MTHGHHPAIYEKTSDSGAANPATVGHVRAQHPVLTGILEAQPDVHDPDVRVGSLWRFSQTYLSDCHEADHEHPHEDPPWLASMMLPHWRTCDVCHSTRGRYDAGRPGHFTACRGCATAGVCMTCGEALVHGTCPANHPKPSDPS